MVPAPFIVVVDANVLFPFTLRDTMLRAAASGFYQICWTAEILDEMERNLVSSGTMPLEKAALLRAKMEQHFPEAKVTGWSCVGGAYGTLPATRRAAALFEVLPPGATRVAGVAFL